MAVNSSTTILCQFNLKMAKGIWVEYSSGRYSDDEDPRGANEKDYYSDHVLVCDVI